MFVQSSAIWIQQDNGWYGPVIEIVIEKVKTTWETVKVLVISIFSISH